MADLVLSSKNNSRRKTKPPHIDFTPMVDLGFLLITFFMFTTTLMEKKSIVLDMPSESDSPQQIPQESTITIIPARDQAFYYAGILENETDLKQCPLTDIRSIIQIKTSEAKNLPVSFSVEAHKLHVIIKPYDDCRYEDVVKLLDEMIINAVPYYAMMDVTADERNRVRKLSEKAKVHLYTK